MHISEIKVGHKASISRIIGEKEVSKYADVTGDDNPIHMSNEYAAQTIFGERIVQGMLVASLISSVIGTKFPGEGTIYLSQNIKFIKPVKIDDEVTAEVEVVSVDVEKKRVTMKTICYKKKERVISGEAVVLIP